MIAEAPKIAPHAGSHFSRGIDAAIVQDAAARFGSVSADAPVARAQLLALHGPAGSGLHGGQQAGQCLLLGAALCESWGLAPQAVDSSAPPTSPWAFRSST